MHHPRRRSIEVGSVCGQQVAGKGRGGEEREAGASSHAALVLCVRTEH